MEKRIYLSCILHANMNYDRYTKSYIREWFPKIYTIILKDLLENPQIKGHIQFSGMTLKTLQEAAPAVIALARRLEKRGQISFTGTYYSEPVNISMDGETDLANAELGTRIIRQELGVPDGFFAQEGAYHPQMPYIINRIGTGWIPINAHDNKIFRPFFLRGKDETVIIGVPAFTPHLIEDIKNNIKRIPEDSLLTLVADMESTGFVKQLLKLGKDLRKENIDVVWSKVSDHINNFAIKKTLFFNTHAWFPENKELSPSFSRWVSKPQDIKVHRETLKAINVFNAAIILNTLLKSRKGIETDLTYQEAEKLIVANDLTWDIEKAADYPDIEDKYLRLNNKKTGLARAWHELLWATNSDARGWYPLYEKSLERMDAFRNCYHISGQTIEKGLKKLAQQKKNKGRDEGIIFYNPGSERRVLLFFHEDKNYCFYEDGGKKLNSESSPSGRQWHTCLDLKLPAYGYKIIKKTVKKQGDNGGKTWNAGTSIKNRFLELTSTGQGLKIKSGFAPLRLSLAPFRMSRYGGEDKLRLPEPHGPGRSAIKAGKIPQMRVQQQIDRYIHLEQVYTLSRDRIYCQWKFHFTHPVIILNERDEDCFQNPGDFSAGGLIALLQCRKKGKIFYDIPYGTNEHSNKKESYLAALSFSFLDNKDGGVLMASSTGEQSFQVHGNRGQIGLCLGKSITCRPLEAYCKQERFTIKHKLKWERDFLLGEYVHRFLIYPFEGSWQTRNIPSQAGAYTKEVYYEKVNNIRAHQESLARVMPDGVELTKLSRQGKKQLMRLNETLGKASTYTIKMGKEIIKGKIRANGIVEIEI